MLSNLSSTLLAQLEAEPIINNEQLLEFNVRSRHIDWKRFVLPLDIQVRGAGVYLNRQADFVSGYRRQVTQSNQRELLVCHDMMGNYLHDRHFESSEKYDDYRFLHWASVDFFCYFSHKYVTIPPCGWLNAAHRHGVPVLGTYIVEGNDGSRRLHEVLSSISSVDRTVAAMVKLCKHFSFEGWLVNVECKVSAQSMPNLYYFVRQLRVATEAEVPHGRVFWYDSVIDNGELQWQNELNERNVEFFRISHAMLLNYSWDDNSLSHTASTVKREQAAAHRVFMGLDVFGRNQLARFQSSQTLARIASAGFSAGIFAPAWCFETLQQYGYNIHNEAGDETVNEAFLARNDRWWTRLWEWLATHPYIALPFYTDFCVGSGKATYVRGACSTAQSFFNLSRQSLQPSVPLGGNAAHSFSTAYAGGSSLQLINHKRAFRLFLTQFTLSQGVLLLGYAYKLDNETQDALDVVLRCTLMGHDPSRELYIFCGHYNRQIIANENCYIRPMTALRADLAHPELQADSRDLPNGWRIRYYVASFGQPVLVNDIGIKYQRGAQTSDAASAYLGAIFVQSLDLATFESVPKYQRADLSGVTAK